MSKNLDINNLAPGRPCRLLVENIYDRDTEKVLLRRELVVGENAAVEVDGRLYCGSGGDFYDVTHLLVGEYPKFSLVEVSLVEVRPVYSQPKLGAEIMAVRKADPSPSKS